MKKSLILILIVLFSVGMVFAGSITAQFSSFDCFSKSKLAGAVSIEDSIGGKAILGFNTSFEEWSISLNAQFCFSKTFNLYNITRFAGVPKRWNGEVGAIAGFRHDRVGMMIGPIAAVSCLSDYADYILQLGVSVEPEYFISEAWFVSFPVRYLFHKGYTTVAAGIGVGCEF